MNNVEIGKITKPQGIKGEFRLRPNSAQYQNYAKIKNMTIVGRNYSVDHVSLRNGFLVVKVSGIDDRNTVESLVGSSVRADIDEVQLGDGQYFYEDLIGCVVVDKDLKVLGDVVNINNYGAGDIYSVLTPNGKEFMFPNVRNVIMDVNLRNKTITLDTKVLSEIISE